MTTPDAIVDSRTLQLAGRNFCSWQTMSLPARSIVTARVQ